MRRRAVVAGVAGLASLGGGYRYYRLANPPTPGPVTTVDVRSGAPDRHEELRPRDPPRVRIAEEGDRVTVDGYLFVGEDHRAKIDAIEFDAATDALSVTVGTFRPIRSQFEWPSDQVSAYDRLVYVVEIAVEAVPSRLTVSELGATGGYRTTTVEP